MTADPAGLQAICDRLGPRTITVFYERWMSRLPLPLTPADRDAGYSWELSMWQVEPSRTIVFEALRHARAFFEALASTTSTSAGLTTSSHVRRAPAPVGTPTEGPADLQDPDRHPRHDRVTVNADYKHSRVKQYLKDGRALRIETVINDPGDLICKRRLPHVEELLAKARAVNARLLDTERVGQGCVLASRACNDRLGDATVVCRLDICEQRVPRYARERAARERRRAAGEGRVLAGQAVPADRTTRPRGPRQPAALGTRRD